VSHLRLWQLAWSVLAAAGIGLAILEWSGIGVVPALALLVGLGWFLRQMVFAGNPATMPWPARAARRVVARPLPLAMGIVAVGALAAVSTGLAVVAVLAAVLTSPLVARARRPGRAGWATLTSDPTQGCTPDSTEPLTASVDLGDYSRLTLHQPPSPLEGLDDRQLCRLWRESFWDLGSPAPAPTLLRIVLIRQACLDELELRDAAALQAWLDSGARASGGPEKFMARRGRGRTEAA
jgi:hypothetical protein